ncbi:MAG: hypothetical protein ABL995_07405 [Bryobacteraceae bacterium]
MIKTKFLLSIALLAAPFASWGHHLPPGGLTHSQIETMSGNPKPGDHEKLAKQFTAEAAAYDDDAKDFEAIAQNSKSSPKIVESCKTGADLARKTAAVYRAIAAEHEAMAKKK